MIILIYKRPLVQHASLAICLQPVEENRCLLIKNILRIGGVQIVLSFQTPVLADGNSFHAILVKKSDREEQSRMEAGKLYKLPFEIRFKQVCHIA
ncbi:MAG: hypothetical protein H7838_01785 [Magnetococcus sp. DMHC-8]